MQDYSSQLELIRQVRELGAVRVKVGDVEVCFSPFPGLTPDAHAVLADLVGQPTTQLDEEAARQEWEKAQYFASGSY